MTAITISCGLGGARRPQIDLFVPPVDVPGAFQSAGWTVVSAPSAGVIEIDVLALPSSNGSAINMIEYSLDGGPFTDLGGTDTGLYPIGGLDLGQNVAVALRATNAVGPGPVAGSKRVTTANVPDAFGATQWSVSELGQGDGLRFSITALPSSADGPLIRVEHNIDGAGWVDLSTNPRTGTFDVPLALSVRQELDVQIRARNEIGAGLASDIKSITLSSSFSLTDTGDSEIEITGVQDTITITIAEPSVYASYDSGQGPGVFVVESTDYTDGPLNLVPPRIIGGDSAIEGTALSVIPGLWIYDGEDMGPTIGYRWRRNGVPIDGETDTTYTVQAADVTQQISVEETVTGFSGASTNTSAPALTAGTVAQTSPMMGDILVVSGSNASALATFQWQLNGANIIGATEATYDTTGQVPGDYRRGVSDGAQGPIYTAAVTVAAAPVVREVAAHMGEHARETEVTVFPVSDIDVSAAAAGDMLVFIIGGAFHAADPSGATVNGKPATRLRQWNAGSGSRGGLFTYVLDAADISAGIISVQSDELGTGGQNSVFDFIITTGGAIIDHQQANRSTSLSVTTTDARNTVFAFVHGAFNRFNGDGPVFSGVMPARLYKLATNNQGSAASILQNAPVGANNIQFTIDGAGNYSVVGVVVE